MILRSPDQDAQRTQSLWDVMHAQSFYFGVPGFNWNSFSCLLNELLTDHGAAGLNTAIPRWSSLPVVSNPGPAPHALARNSRRPVASVNNSRDGRGQQGRGVLRWSELKTRAQSAACVCGNAVRASLVFSCPCARPHPLALAATIGMHPCLDGEELAELR